IGMAAGVGKTYRMLKEAHALLARGADVCIGIIETHKRADTARLIDGIPALPMKKSYYKGRLLEELDLDAVKLRKPEVILIDELAHTNIPGSKNAKRWQDVQEILDTGISVISAVNIQHIESINKEVEKIAGIEVKERVPDSIIQAADEVVNIDLTIDELIKRLHEGKIYDSSKVGIALTNFFKEEKLLQLRELALKEVAGQVGRKITREVAAPSRNVNAILTCISTNDKSAKNMIRRSSRLAALYDSHWVVMYVQTPRESLERISSAEQRMLINNLKLAAELDAEIIKIKGTDIAQAIYDTAIKKDAGIIIMGRPVYDFFKSFWRPNLLKKIIKRTKDNNIDILIIANEKS
ncbi:MAG TPA: sensor histidine kinase KdpD, partial [Ignavibacteriales bacterium]|nr:sensor histidine kinase KdpD [Ignavibacteriales bacterium]